jgi:hypothetical protein
LFFFDAGEVNFFENIDLAEIFSGDFHEGFFGPGKIPDDGGIVDKSWVHSGVVSECVSSFAHTNHEMEIILNSGKEEVNKVIIKDSGIFFKFMVFDIGFFDFVSDNRVVFFLREQIRDFSNRENIVDIFNKSFINNLVVGEKEYSWFIVETSFFSPTFYFFSELFHAVRF